MNWCSVLIHGLRNWVTGGDGPEFPRCLIREPWALLRGLRHAEGALGSCQENARLKRWGADLALTRRWILTC